MYQYFYDSFLGEEKHGKALSMIENRLADLGLQGKVERLNMFKDPRELIADGVKKGVKTVVAVGNGETLHRVINGLGGEEVTVGFIPVGPQDEMAKTLGVEEGIQGCDCLASRLTQQVDLGKINDQYFISHVKIMSEGVYFRCGNDYCVRPEASHRLEIYNLPSLNVSADPRDGYLEVRVRKAGTQFGDGRERGILFGKKNRAEKEESFFPVKKIFLECGGGAKLLVDGYKTVDVPAEITVVPGRLKIIVGKKRFF